MCINNLRNCFLLLVLSLAIVHAQQDAASLATAASKGDKAALAQLTTLAGKGHSSAQFNLGSMYDFGDGVPKDSVQALAWYRKAAEQGNADAQGALGLMYVEDDGLPKDFVAAYMWNTLAAARGVDIAKNLRDALEKQMTPAQIAKAQKMSKEWSRRNNQAVCLFNGLGVLAHPFSQRSAPQLRTSLRSQAQRPLNLAGQSKPLEKPGWIHVVLTRFVDYADEIVRVRVGVIHYRIQFSDVKGGAEAGIPYTHGKILRFRSTRRHS